MARALAQQGRQLSEIGDLFLAEWYRVLPDHSGSSPADPLTLGGKMDLAALTAALNQILDANCEAILDGNGSATAKLKIVVPLPPVTDRQELKNYLKYNTDYARGMGAAVVFGCGK